MISEDTRLRRDINKILLDLPRDRKKWRTDYWILYCGALEELVRALTKKIQCSDPEASERQVGYKGKSDHA